MQDEQQPGLVGLSAEIVSAYVAKNHIQRSEIPQLIASVHDALRNVAKPAAASIELRWDCHRSPPESADGPASGDAGPPADGVSVVSRDLVHGMTERVALACYLAAAG